MRKRVLIVISSLKIGGGAERVASTLGTELYHRDYEVHYLTFYKHTENYDFKGKHVCLNESFKEGVISKGAKLFSRARKIAKYCKKNNIDTCIGFMEAANFPTILSKVLFRSKSKIIVSVHNEPSKLFGNNIEKILMKLTYKRANTVIGVSENVSSKLREFNVRNVKTIYNVNNISEFIRKSNDDKNMKFNFSEENFVFINIGRLTEQKNQITLINAFSRINYKNKKLLILGEGSKRKESEKKINELGLNNYVFLLGNIDNVYPYIKNSDCFVLSSEWEGFGLTIVEALSLNKPVISTDCKYGPREILSPGLKNDKKINYPYYGEYGILVTPVLGKKQEEELSRVMEEFINNKKLQKQYLKGLKRAKDFDTDKVIEEWEKVI